MTSLNSLLFKASESEQPLRKSSGTRTRDAILTPRMLTARQAIQTSKGMRYAGPTNGEVSYHVSKDHNSEALVKRGKQRPVEDPNESDVEENAGDEEENPKHLSGGKARGPYTYPENKRSRNRSQPYGV